MDALYWHLKTKAQDFPENDSPPFVSIKQDRIAFFVNLLGRVVIRNSGSTSMKRKQIYIFYGLGSGPLYTQVQYGVKEWAVGCQILGGISIPLYQSFNFCFEGRYILAPDADVLPKPEWQVETSGTPVWFRIGPHLDTRFISLLLGVEYKFF